MKRLLRWLREFVASCFDVEFELVDRDGRPLNDLLVCRVCRTDVHNVSDVCPKQQYALCSTCGQRVPLDYYGQCLLAGERWRYHHIVRDGKQATAIIEAINNDVDDDDRVSLGGVL